METKELKITIPEGYCIDEKASTFEKIVFKKKDTKPKSWEEYCHTRLNSKETRFGYHIGNQCDIVVSDWDDVFNCFTWRDVLPSKELAEAFLAMMQLMSLRQAWIGDWKPDWNGVVYQYCIITYENKYIVDEFSRLYHALSFPTKEMAEDFMNCFKDLLEIARPLI